MQWRRLFFDAEIDMAAKFMEDIEGLTIHPRRHDKWVWKGDPSPSGIYSVEMPYENQDRVFNDLWELQIPTKASFFAWRLIRNKLPTKTNLRRRNVEINDSMCPFCRNFEEDAAHLFFSCDRVMPLWWKSMSWINMVGAFPQTPRHRFLQHSFCRLSGIRMQRWQSRCISLTRSIWHHRNRIVFSNDNFNANKLMEDAIFLWLDMT
ncbi:hypothetical protein HKD37_11G032628 [Glycine soja]|nr:hypothetical protein GmHk_11G033318 [Glycine max]